jgi:hypothetical protein
VLQLRQPLLEIRRLDRVQLQVHQRSQASSDPGVHFARKNIGDQSRHRVAHRDRTVQCRQWIATFGSNTALASASDSAQFRGLVGIGMKKAQPALGGRRGTGFPSLRPVPCNNFSFVL